MRRLVLAALACACLAGCSSGMFSSSAKSRTAEAQPEAVAPPKPRDARTRAKLHTELGAMYLSNKNLAVALEELTIAIAIDPDYAKAYSTRGVAGYYVREIATADQDFQRALRIDANDPEINNNYGWFLCQIGREQEGLPYFQRAIKNPLYETPEKAYLNAGACYTRLGDLVKAEEYVQHSLRIAPDNLQGQLQLATINYQLGHYDLARQQLGEIFRRAEPSAEALWLMVRVERQLGDRKGEARYANQLRRQYPLAPETQELLGGHFQ
ncbi:type IV pilus biogenesis/stability protein PilW [Accumulibacter sp.]|uniref:type IV pilus biogenesis/stability protein PilW n=1 Tax=Accumulibacter sp. TaxID=2053492 RepID=UPI002600F940|nr:type IV pilus biogenesis/stability protein PilW [Accumulibacter sp.]MCM8594127.1 type IV pilus biogenesis/stability protein PilW [Accumulibacter sp.]MCM8625689.1 type IV pilus biogenesis/stability protein PilW [Accumulibacter sp.]MDS4048270.1 type IV pilus biogenesis/stability protein PilW [Accumulibacter sp.]